MNKHLKTYLTHCKFERKLDPKTLKAYKADLTQFINYAKGQFSIFSLEKIDKNVIKAYIETLNHLSNNTIRRKIASLKAFFNFHEFEDEILVNPMRKIRFRIKAEKRIPRTLNKYELENFLKQVYLCEKDEELTYYRSVIIARDIAIVELMVSTGLRVSEVSNLTKQSFNSDFTLLKVVGKGNKERRMPITNLAVREALIRYNHLSRSHAFFFTNRRGNKLSTQSIRIIIQNLGKKSTLKEKVNPHTLRHTFATLLLENDTDIRYIQQFLGHSSVVTTQIYTKVTEQKKTEILLKNNPRNFIDSRLS